jgi:hypothetical protein
MSAPERTRLGGRHHPEIVAAGATMPGHRAAAEYLRELELAVMVRAGGRHDRGRGGRCPGIAKLQPVRRYLTYRADHG